MPRISAQEAADKWGRRLKGASQDIAAGIDRVTEAPGIAAAKQGAVMLNNLTESVASGKWGRNVAAVSAEEWKKAAKTKGVPRIAAGVDGAQPKMGAKLGEVFSAIDGALAEVNKTPRGTLEDNIARAATFAREMARRMK